MLSYQNLAYQLEQNFTQEVVAELKRLGRLAAEQGQNLYLVGGAVRDLLLGRFNPSGLSPQGQSLDFDLVVEGDAIKLAGLLCGEGRVAIHPRFGTAKIHHQGMNIDIATARGEDYPHPGALPVVYPSNIKMDLLRRDFTINAMAINLNPERFGELLDPSKGEEDLSRQLIRVLHQNSFIDDATRILRALRYEQRFDFHLETTTEKLLRRDVAMLKTISGDRLRHEIELILREDFPEKVLGRAEELGVLQQIHPRLKGDGWLKKKFASARRGRLSVASCPSPLGEQARPYFILLVYQLTKQEVEEFIAYLKLPKRLAQPIREALQLKEVLPSLAIPELTPSQIYHQLQTYSPEAILTTALASESSLIHQRFLNYLNQWRYIKPSLDGEAIKKMGISAGPSLGKMLQKLQEAKLDGEVKNKADEEALVKQWLKEIAENP
jgi:tRNA nucleotidyltransferase (CCA-adding enzyme)